ncbi:hypothetical protein [Naasia sp.]|uniref:hypothetical protein n=1 Tax=Naasia sp. TaxID=2546198 RepID=UPI002614F8C0|nr:hypothetical protein [Naasia sp.]
MTPAEITVRPAGEVSGDDVSAVFGTRAPPQGAGARRLSAQPIAELWSSRMPPSR